MIGGVQRKICGSSPQNLIHLRKWGEISSNPKRINAKTTIIFDAKTKEEIHVPYLQGEILRSSQEGVKMPPVWHEVRLRGKKGEVKIEGLLNSGSDLVVLPDEIAKRIGPKPIGRVKIELADGSTLWRTAYEIEIEMVDKESNEIRKAKTHAAIEKRDYPLIGTVAMEGLKVIPDIVRGKVLFV